MKCLQQIVQTTGPHLVKPFCLVPLLLSALLLAGCTKGNQPSDIDPDVNDPKGRRRPQNLAKFPFRDVTKQAGIAFHHVNGAFGKKLLPETMGSGVVAFDYNNDGKQDLLFINSCYWPGREDNKKPAPTQALYRNDDKNKFTDVSKSAGLDLTLYGMGASVGDIDNDGYPDLFITAIGGNRLFHNQPHGKERRFVEITQLSKDLAPKGGWETTGDFFARKAEMDFPSSAAFFDYNNDGWLDLFVCNYVTWSPAYDIGLRSTLTGGGRAYGSPKAFHGTHCQLFENLGKKANGKEFKDVSRHAGIPVIGPKNQKVGKALGVIVFDPDKDGRQDIIVANDTVRNFFFHNQGNGTFQERGIKSGVAYAKSKPRGAMGIDWGEYGPGVSGVIIGNFANEPDTLLRLDFAKRLLFSEVAYFEGVGGPSKLPLVFGLFWFDLDLDGRLDLLTCNGHLEPDIERVQPGQRFKQPPQLFWNTGGAVRNLPRFHPLTADDTGADLFEPIVGRGSAYADIDNDGDLDVILSANNGPARLLLNENNNGNNWVRLQLEGNGTTCNRSAIGARVTLSAGGKKFRAHITTARGYLSQSESILTFGLGTVNKIDRVEIHWPGTAQPQIVTGLRTNRLNKIVAAK